MSWIMRDITMLENEARTARSRYKTSKGAEWVRLVLALKTLAEAYRSQNLLKEAIRCDDESDKVLERIQQKTTSPIRISESSESVFAYFDETNHWAMKAEESRKELENGGSTTKYAKTVNALCEFLCLSGQPRLALLKYEEALQVLLNGAHTINEERERTYLIIVILLKASKCALDLGNESLARSYSVYPFLYLAENAEKDNLDSASINWSYVAELCKSLMNDYGNR